MEIEYNEKDFLNNYAQNKRLKKYYEKMTNRNYNQINERKVMQLINELAIELQKADITPLTEKRIEQISKYLELVENNCKPDTLSAIYNSLLIIKDELDLPTKNKEFERVR